MIIYGVALLAICTLAGVILGDMLGVLLGVKSNVGGVGIAMILLICARLWMEKNGGMSKDCEMGVGFWGGAVYPGGGRDGCATECRHRAEGRACCRSGRCRFGGVVCLHHRRDQPYQPGRAIAQGRAAAEPGDP